MLEAAQVYAVCVPVFAAMAVAEIALYERLSGRLYPRATALRALQVWAGFAVTTELSKRLVLPLYELCWQHRLATLPVSGWASWAAVFVVEEFLYYWLHRLMHSSRWPWAHHRVHHEIDRLTYLTGLQNGWLGLLAGKWLYTLPLALLGVEPQVLMTQMSISLLYNFVLHSELLPRLGWLEWVLNTPSHHRVHHSYLPADLDRNFGGVLIVFDRLFGTYRAEAPAGASAFGLGPAPRQAGVLELNFAAWYRLGRAAYRARSGREALQALFGRPPSETPGAAPAAADGERREAG